MITISKYVMDMAFYKRPKTIDLTWTDNPHSHNWWSWCDALFMAPPAFAKMSKATNDRKYINEMDRMWKYTRTHKANGSLALLTKLRVMSLQFYTTMTRL